jgi:hypothetical protein
MANVYIAGKDFESKKSALDHISKVLRSNGSRTYKPPSQGFEFLLALLDRHPERDEKLSHGLTHFEVVMKNAARTNYTVYLVNARGQKLDFSWRVCVTGKKNDLLTAAMRLAIKDQIDEFKLANSHVTTCQLCNVKPAEHADHIVKFRHLKERFLTYRTAPTSFDECDRTHAAKFKPEDAAFEKEWSDYHRAVSELRMLCASCNLRIK